jgi:hypothetical protein
MKSLKLTPKQKEAYELIAKYPGGFLRRHIKMSGTICWRLVDERRNPISNISDRYIDALKELDLFEAGSEPGTYVLKATVSMKAKDDDISHLGIHANSFSKAS